MTENKKQKQNLCVRDMPSWTATSRITPSDEKHENPKKPEWKTNVPNNTTCDKRLTGSSPPLPYGIRLPSMLRCGELSRRNNDSSPMTLFRMSFTTCSGSSLIDWGKWGISSLIRMHRFFIGRSFVRSFLFIKILAL
jgi:hypothetical protein